MILNAQQIREAVEKGEIEIDPFEESQLQPATYDFRVGAQGATTSGKKIQNLKEDGYLLVKPGDFAFVTVRETIALGLQHTGRFGLRSYYARKGLIATTGPQIDPGFRGRLIIGLTNLTPNDVAVPFNDDLVSVEFHRLEEPTEKPYDGPFQGKTELGPEEIAMITERTSMVYSEVITMLSSLSANVSELSQKIDKLASEFRSYRWVTPIIVGVGMTVIAVLVGLIALMD